MIYCILPTPKIALFDEWMMYIYIWKTLLFYLILRTFVSINDFPFCGAHYRVNKERYCHGKLSVHLSVCVVEVSWLHSLEYIRGGDVSEPTNAPNERVFFVMSDWVIRGTMLRHNSKRKFLCLNFEIDSHHHKNTSVLCLDFHKQSSTVQTIQTTE